jgi:hypothetical protein
MKNLVFLIIILFTSCDIAIDQPDPFDGTLSCIPSDTIEDFCKIEIKRGDTHSQIQIFDEYFPDFGTNEYLAVIQYIHNGTYQCSFSSETLPLQITVPNYQLIDSRIIILRTTISDEGFTVQEVQSLFFRVKNIRLE